MFSSTLELLPAGAALALCSVVTNSPPRSGVNAAERQPSSDLASVIAPAIETVEEAAEARGVQIGGSWTPQMAIRRRFSTNAAGRSDPALDRRQFSPKGGCVRVTLRHLHSHAEVVMQDNGARIRADFLPHVFDRFQQADASRTR
jgi:two-component system CheB/CheR fusion protein